MKSFIGFYNKSVYMTYLGVCFSVIGIYLCVIGQLNYAMMALVLAGVCDMFDGMIARKVKRTAQEMEFGIQIDSLADVVNFLALPAAYFVSNEYFEAGYLIFLIIYVVAGVVRLAYFNVVTSKDTGPNKAYSGLPVTSAAIIIPVAHIFLNSVLVLYVYLLMGILFVLNFKVKKPGTKLCVATVIIAVILCAYLVMV
ncbi:CDP-alcohol phosphatidyltransferase family protein [Mollicutes bacterium LVI A0039]|nr:CDP-alcohol phosphatidyltransferase family protein [Mollicutes bacterium LVI A0039]